MSSLEETERVTAENLPGCQGSKPVILQESEGRRAGPDPSWGLTRVGSAGQAAFWLRETG